MTQENRINIDLNFLTDEAVANLNRLTTEIQKLKGEVVDLDMRRTESKVKVQQLEAAERKLASTTASYAAQVQRSTTAHANSTAAINKQIAKLREEASVMDMSSQGYAKKQIQIQNLSKQFNGVSGSSGQATASAIEFGRVVSDAPYGIRGMANNISQLSTQLISVGNESLKASGKAITFRTSLSAVTIGLKQMWKALAGPLGLLLAMQAIIAAFDYFGGGAKKAKKEVEDLTDSFTEAATEMYILDKIMNTWNMSAETLTKIVKLANEEYEDLNLKIEENGRLTTESQEALDLYTESLLRNAKAKAIAEVIQEELTFQIREEGKALKDQLSTVETVGLGIIANITGAGYASAQGVKIAMNNLDDKLESSRDVVAKYMAMLTEDDGALALTLFGKDKKDKGAKTLRDFKKKLLDMSKAILKLRKDAADLDDIDDVERLARSQDYERQGLELVKTNFIEKERLRLENFKKKNKDAKKQAEAEAIFAEEVTKAELEYQVAVDAQKVLQAKQTANLLEDIRLQQLSRELGTDVDVAESNLDIGMLNEDTVNMRMEQIEELTRKVWDAEDADFANRQVELSEKLRLAGEDKMSIAQELADQQRMFDQNRMAEEIQLEQDKINAKKEIQLEYVGWIGGLSNVFKAIGKENEAIALAALILEKGSAVAGIVINTISANNEIKANMAAIGSSYAAATAQAFAISPFAGAAAAAGFKAASITEQAAGAARITKNTIGAGISIAGILATTLKGSGGSASSAGGSSGGGSGGGAAAFTPNFNIVGNSESNQLADSIANQVNNPTQAYVVYDDIETAAQLKANAINSSGI